MSRNPSFGESRCDHRRHSTTTVYTELGCHARCLGCGTLGPGCFSSKAALQEFLAPTYASASVRYAAVRH